jgi:branched-chain amino acid transport system permease protein
VTERSDSTFSAYATIFGVAALLAATPLVSSANTVLNGIVLALIIALAGQGWNVLGGYGGQLSFGHAAFFGVGAYGTALLQERFGCNAYIAFVVAVVLGAAVGAAIGFLSFRAGLRGSYFALVTLAFAEVFRIVANASSFTGGATGVLIKLDVRWSNFQFISRAAFLWIAVFLVTIGLVVASVVERSRFGSYLIAIRENENAAKALGVDTLKIKTQALALSAAMTAAAGAFYAQYFLFVDANIGFGSAISVEALLAPIIGGLGTIYGPLIGALALYGLSEGAKALTSRTPGMDVAIYGLLLIVVIAFAPRGLKGLVTQIGRGLRLGTAP